MNKQKNTQILIRNRTKFLVFISFALVLFSVCEVAQAAEISIESGIKEVRIGDQFEVDFFINAESEDINALEGVIRFSPEFLELKEIRDGGSIINLLIEKPRLERVGDVIFSGITPGGFKSEKGRIVSFIFEAKREGDNNISISNVSVLKNDGKGTSIKTKISDFKFRILKSESQIPDSKFEIPIDIDSPESFRPEIASSPDVFDGKWFVVFVTQDKGSGIDHYEIREGIFGKFVVGESPYLLQNQKLNKKIAVKAFDKTGNERIEIIYPLNWSPWYENYWIIGIISLGIITAYLMKRRMRKRI